jgi:hypothetical protein
MPHDAILASLRRRGIKRICHMTPCDRLPDIFRYGGLLSLSERRARGIVEPDHPHYWGAPGKQEELREWVISSFMSPWWMCLAHDEELAMILIDADTVCADANARFCPINSAKSDYSAGEIQARAGIEAFDDCFENDATYQAKNAEVFMRRMVPLAAFRELVMCDKAASDHWLPRVNDAFRAANPQPEVPRKGVTVVLGGTAYHRFPGTYAPRRRIRDA